VHQPRLDAEISECGEIGLDENADSGPLFRLSEGPLFKSIIIMRLLS
jgi:hypothetical protein